MWHVLGILVSIFILIIALHVYKKNSPQLTSLQTFTVFFIPVLSLMFAGLGIFNDLAAAEKSLENKLNDKKFELSLRAKSATDLANEIVKELPRDFRKSFSGLNIEPIISDVEFSGLDMKINFGFSTNHNDIMMFHSEMEYGPGEYRLAPNTSVLLIKVFGKALRQELLNYLDNYNLVTKIKGVADGIPVKKSAVYRGEFHIKSHKYYDVNLGKWQTITLIPEETRLSNKSFAFLRAYHAFVLINNLEEFKSNPIDIYVEETNEVGSRQCIIQVKIIIKDALKESYNDFKTMEKIAFHIQ